MATLTDDAEYDAGETFENVPSSLSDAENHDNYYGRRLRTICPLMPAHVMSQITLKDISLLSPTQQLLCPLVLPDPSAKSNSLLHFLCSPLPAYLAAAEAVLPLSRLIMLVVLKTVTTPPSLILSPGHHQVFPRLRLSFRIGKLNLLQLAGAIRPLIPLVMLRHS
ncbi:unnamed protein product [Protopolystoma xenopodis]|uniref:Uncharacterized protein n=1 Tax=Protopolystoma xenopodis TaxID=117903 RepID=A0A3S5A8M2_9PLAT|nr:unnamed protein product [Protopolystoma xenopodis]